MTAWSWLRNAWRCLRHKERIDRELADELASFVDLLTDEKIAAGSTPQAARRAALVELGGIEPVRDETRAQRPGAFLESLWQDVRFASRVLWRAPAFTAAAMLTLALGIGASTAIFSVVHAVLLKDLPFPESERLVFAWTESHSGSRPFSPPDFVDFGQATTAFDQLGAVYSPAVVGIEIDGRVEPVHARDVSSNYLEIYGLRPHAGRTFLPEEDQPGPAPPAAGGPPAPGVAMISHEFWHARFGGDPAAVGRVIQIAQSPYRIIGVTPPGFRAMLPDDDLTAAVAVYGLSGLDLARMPRDASFVRVVGRLRHGVDLQRARAEAATFARRQGEQHALHREQGFRVELAPLQREVARAYERPILILFGAVGFLMLIACANLVTLMLARLEARQHELAVRLTLGAGRGRVARQVLTECLLLSLAGAAAGVLLAAGLLRGLLALAPTSLPHVERIGLHAPVLAFSLGSALLATLLVGGLPALRFSRPQVAATLKLSGRGHSLASGRLDAALVVSEVALCLILVIGTGLLLRSFVSLMSVKHGFQPDGVLTVDTVISTRRYPRYPDPAPRLRFVRALSEGLSRLKGVDSVGLALVVPLSRQDTGHSYASVALAERGQSLPHAKYRPVTPGYFRAVGTRIVAGSDFTWTDLQDRRKVAIVDQRLARTAWPGANPVGQRLRLETWVQNQGRYTLEPFWAEVIGVAEDVRSGSLERADIETVYIPYGLYAVNELSVLVRGSIDAATLAPLIRAEIARLDRELVVYNVHLLGDLVSSALAPQRFSLMLVGAFAVAGLLLELVGLYAVITFAASRRRREIGIRMALGASAGQIRRMILGRGARLVTAGLLLGLAGASVLARLLISQLHEVAPGDLATYASVSALTFLISMLACDLPARRAARQDPVEVMRE